MLFRSGLCYTRANGEMCAVLVYDLATLQAVSVGQLPQCLDRLRGLDTLFVREVIVLVADSSSVFYIKPMPKDYALRLNFSKLVVAYNEIGIDDLIRCYALHLTWYLGHAL